MSGYHVHVDDCKCKRGYGGGCVAKHECPGYAQLLKFFNDKLGDEYEIFQQDNEIVIDFECLSPWNGHDTDDERDSVTLNLDTLTPEILGSELECVGFTTRFCRLNFKIFNTKHFLEVAEGSHLIKNWKGQ